MPFPTGYLQSLVGELRSKNVMFAQGLSDVEILQIESRNKFKFPLDLRALVQFALPVSESFPNWRRGWVAKPIIEWQGRTQVPLGHSLVPIQEQLAWPAESICFDIERNDFWVKEWGTRPKDLQSALATASAEIAKAPKLIPVYSHRFLPSEPCIAGNPVFSVQQTDIIHYGFDLASYFANEFALTSPEWAATAAREIPFWSALL